MTLFIHRLTGPHGGLRLHSGNSAFAQAKLTLLLFPMKNRTEHNSFLINANVASILGSFMAYQPISLSAGTLS